MNLYIPQNLVSQQNIQAITLCNNPKIQSFVIYSTSKSKITEITKIRLDLAKSNIQYIQQLAPIHSQNNILCIEESIPFGPSIRKFDQVFMLSTSVLPREFFPNIIYCESLDQFIQISVLTRQELNLRNTFRSMLCSDLNKYTKKLSIEKMRQLTNKWVSYKQKLILKQVVKMLPVLHRIINFIEDRRERRLKQYYNIWYIQYLQSSLCKNQQMIKQNQESIQVFRNMIHN